MVGGAPAVHLWSGLAANVLSAVSGGFKVEIAGTRRCVPTFDVAPRDDWERDRSDFAALAAQWEEAGNVPGHRACRAVRLMDVRGLPHAIALLRAGETRWVDTVSEIVGAEPSEEGDPASRRGALLRWLDANGYR